MGYRTLKDCLDDLERSGQLLRIEVPIDARLEAAEIVRRVYQANGPALLFTQVKDCSFPMVGNLFGSLSRVQYMFRDTLDSVRRLIAVKGDPGQLASRPWRHLSLARSAWHMLPRRVIRGPVLECETTVERLPQVVGWPKDGGPFITLPQVYTENPHRPGWKQSNLGMYRIQMSGNQYRTNEEVGLHYQIHRGIGVHHAYAIQRGERLRVNVFVGGPPAMTVSAVMPLPEGIPELSFAGALGGRRLSLVYPHNGLPIPAEADFCLSGYIEPNKQLPEGPFGDHLGYYSLAHDFPVMRVERVYHRRDAIWPFTSVGRPPQEDTSFGKFIHELTGPIIPAVLPGVKAVHAVDAAGVHPLLLAVGSERYVPYSPRTRPQELLTQANAILGQGQMSLAKYLWIAAEQDDHRLDPHHIEEFFQHILRRVDWTRDLHFQTRTTIDTLDYSGSGFNEGSKLVVAAVGPSIRELPSEISADLRLPDGFQHPQLAMPGVLLVESPPYVAHGESGTRDKTLERFCNSFTTDSAGAINRFPLIVLVDDSRFAAQTLNNWLWITFTRSDPAADIEGIGSFVEGKHWGCRGALVIDARIKPHHAPPLVEDPEVTRRVDALAARGGPLSGVL